MPRLFSLEEANALIPALERDLSRLRELYEQSGPAREKLSRVEQYGRSNGKDLASELRELQETLQSWRAEAETILGKINELGCEVKDLEQGLIDFPSEREGRTVYLCWKRGEARIEFWHELSTGFAGRMPL
jgi:hypothetical protein